MKPEQHLRILSILDFISAGLAALGAVIVGGTTAALVVLGVASGDDDLLAALLPTVVLEGVVTLFVVALAVLALVAGLRVRQGKGRLLQTLLALVSVCNLPLGTAFAAYSLWVCWIDDGTVALLGGDSADEG